MNLYDRGMCRGGRGSSTGLSAQQIFPLSPTLICCYYTPMPYNFLARVHKTEPIPGMKGVMLELVRDEDFVELEEGDEFVTVVLQVDPFK